MTGPATRTIPSADDLNLHHNQVIAPEAIDGERKTVTALFADIRGSRELHVIPNGTYHFARSKPGDDIA
jgi:class 3 adenylate cyclase